MLLFPSSCVASALIFNVDTLCPRPRFSLHKHIFIFLLVSGHVLLACFLFVRVPFLLSPVLAWPLLLCFAACFVLLCSVQCLRNLSATGLGKGQRGSCGATKRRGSISAAGAHSGGTLCPAGVHSGVAICFAEEHSDGARSPLEYLAAALYSPAGNLAAGQCLPWGK